MSNDEHIPCYYHFADDLGARELSQDDLIGLAFLLREGVLLAHRGQQQTGERLPLDQLLSQLDKCLDAVENDSAFQPPNTGHLRHAWRHVRAYLENTSTPYSS